MTGVDCDRTMRYDTIMRFPRDTGGGGTQTYDWALTRLGRHNPL